VSPEATPPFILPRTGTGEDAGGSATGAILGSAAMLLLLVGAAVLRQQRRAPRA
jgi:hypothetical protein